ncbi:hypothetical protein Hte_008991 [Hypoxylon texense]
MARSYGSLVEADFRITNRLLKMLPQTSIPQFDYAALATHLLLDPDQARHALLHVFHKMRWFTGMVIGTAAEAANSDMEILSQEEFHVFDVAFKLLHDADRSIISIPWDQIHNALGLGNPASAKERWRQIRKKQGWFQYENVANNGNNDNNHDEQAATAQDDAPAAAPDGTRPQQTIEDVARLAIDILSRQVSECYVALLQDPNNPYLEQALRQKEEECQRVRATWLLVRGFIEHIKGVVEENKDNN